MFSGLVEAKVAVLGLEPEPGGVRLKLARPASYTDLVCGDSIAISGCCLTLIELDDSSISFQAGQETLGRTGLGRLGDRRPG